MATAQNSATQEIKYKRPDTCLHVRGIKCKVWPTKAKCTKSRGVGEVHMAQVGGEEARRHFRGQGNLKKEK